MGMRDSKTNKISSRVAGFDKTRGILQGVRGGQVALLSSAAMTTLRLRARDPLGRLKGGTRRKVRVHMWCEHDSWNARGRVRQRIMAAASEDVGSAEGAMTLPPAST